MRAPCRHYHLEDSDSDYEYVEVGHLGNFLEPTGTRRFSGRKSASKFIKASEHDLSEIIDGHSNDCRRSLGNSYSQKFSLTRMKPTQQPANQVEYPSFGSGKKSFHNRSGSKYSDKDKENNTRGNIGSTSLNHLDKQQKRRVVTKSRSGSKMRHQQSEYLHRLNDLDESSELHDEINKLSAEKQRMKKKYRDHIRLDHETIEELKYQEERRRDREERNHQKSIEKQKRLRETNRMLEDELEEIKNEAAEREVEIIDKARLVTKDLTRRLNQVNMEKEEMRKSTEDLTEFVDQLRDQIHKKDSALKKVKSINQDLTAEKDKLENDLAKSIGEMEHAEVHMHKANHTIDLLRETAQAKTEQMEEMKKQMEELKNQLREKTELSVRKQNALEAVKKVDRAEFNRLLDEVMELREKIKSGQALNKKINVYCKDLEEQVATLNTRLLAQEKSFEHNYSKISLVNKELESSKEENFKLRKELTMIKQENHDISRNTGLAYNSELDKVKIKLRETELALSKRTEELEKSLSDNAKLVLKIKNLESAAVNATRLPNAYTVTDKLKYRDIDRYQPSRGAHTYAFSPPDVGVLGSPYRKDQIKSSAKKYALQSSESRKYGVSSPKIDAYKFSATKEPVRTSPWSGVQDPVCLGDVKGVTFVYKGDRRAESPLHKYFHDKDNSKLYRDSHRDYYLPKEGSLSYANLKEYRQMREMRSGDPTTPVILPSHSRARSPGRLEETPSKDLLRKRSSPLETPKNSDHHNYHFNVSKINTSPLNEISEKSAKNEVEGQQDDTKKPSYKEIVTANSKKKSYAEIMMGRHSQKSHDEKEKGSLKALMEHGQTHPHQPGMRDSGGSFYGAIASSQNISRNDKRNKGENSGEYRYDNSKSGSYLLDALKEKENREGRGYINDEGDRDGRKSLTNGSKSNQLPPTYGRELPSMSALSKNYSEEVDYSQPLSKKSVPVSVEKGPPTNVSAPMPQSFYRDYFEETEKPKYINVDLNRPPQPRRSQDETAEFGGEGSFGRPEQGNTGSEWANDVTRLREALAKKKAESQITHEK